MLVWKLLVKSENERCYLRMSSVSKSSTNFCECEGDTQNNVSD